MPEGFNGEADIASGQGADERLSDGPLVVMVNLLIAFLNELHRPFEFGLCRSPSWFALRSKRLLSDRLRLS